MTGNFYKVQKFKLSHFGGTVVSVNLNIRDPWSQLIAPNPNHNTGAVYLGSILFPDVENNLKYTPLSYANFRSLSGETGKLTVVQVLEEFEKQHSVNLFFDRGVKKGVLNSSSRQVSAPDTNYQTIAIALKDFNYDSSNEAETASQQIHGAIKRCYKAHKQGLPVYFHCKAGVNRSFKIATLFKVYLRIMKSRHKPSLHQLEIKEKRPCVDFNRTHWSNQLKCIKNFLIEINQAHNDELIESSPSTHQTTGELNYNRVRLEAQYELYRYRMHLKSTKAQYSSDESKNKEHSINQLIRSTQMPSNNSKMSDVKRSFSATISNHTSLLGQSRQHTHLGYAFLSTLRHILFYLFTLSACPSKGKKLIRALKQKQRSSTILPGLRIFFGLTPQQPKATEHRPTRSSSFATYS